MTALKHRLVRFLRASLLHGMLLHAAGAAFAAEPFITDDARTLDSGTCKIETGKRGQPDGRETWVLPACNLFFDVELELGFVRARPDDAPAEPARIVQAKGLWREIERDGYGLGWLIASEIARHPQPGARRAREHAATLLASYPAIAERLTLHANLGARYNRDERRSAVAGGFLAELEVAERVAVLAEIYGSSRTRRGFQAGVRVTLVPDHAELTLTRGGDDAAERGRRYWAVSLELTSPKLTGKPARGAN